MDGFFEVDAGFFSRDAEVNMATASAYGVSPTRCYGSLEEMLESERVTRRTLYFDAHSRSYSLGNESDESGFRCDM